MSKGCSKIAEIDHHLTTVEHHQITAILFCGPQLQSIDFPSSTVKSRLNGSGFEDVLPVADLRLDNIGRPAVDIDLQRFRPEWLHHTS